MAHTHRVSRALSALKVGALGTAMGLVAAGFLHTSPAPDPASSQYRLERTQAAAARLASRTGGLSECDTVGAPRGSAVIRTTDGRVRVVPFAEGWSVFKGESPGSLVAVCSTGS